MSSPHFQTGHTFFIQREDVHYIKYLYNLYQNLIPCVHNNYLKNINGLTNNAIRHSYYITEGNERIRKAIHYYKNVKSSFHHFNIDTVQDHWDLHAPDSDGNVVSHFRVDSHLLFSKNFLDQLENSILIMNMYFLY